MRKIPKVNTKKRQKGNIPEPFEPKSTNHELPVISFRHLCENSFRLHDLSKDELKRLSKFLKQISTMKWQEIQSSSGIRLKHISPYNITHQLPQSVSEDVTISEMRVSGKHRLWGFRNGTTFYVIWFEPQHAVCPM